MADEPLRLSTVPPISAEGDYDAICVALRQTGRGRWFLEECARRSRNGHGMTFQAAVQPSNEPIRGERFADPQMDVLALSERLQDLAWTMREHDLDQGTCEHIEGLAAAILSASSLRDPRRAQKLSEALGHLERRVREMIEATRELTAATPPKDGIVGIDEDLFAAPSGAPAESPHVVSARSSQSRRAEPPSTAADPLAALNAMSDEEKIALFT
jgi:hypothetical protein